MPPRREEQASLAEAEQKAREGNNESQDSQQVLNAYMTEYGVGSMSSSPTCGRDGDEDPEPPSRPMPAQPKQQAPGSSRKGEQHMLETLSQTLVGAATAGRRGRPQRGARTTSGPAQQDAPTSSTRGLRPSSTSTTEADAPRIEDGKKAGDGDSAVATNGANCRELLSSPLAFDDGELPPTAGETFPGPVVESPNPLVRSDHLPSLRASGVMPASRMDSSQSPTQSNDGRSYERYFQRSSPSLSHPVPLTDPVHEPENLPQSTPHSASHESVMTLGDDDTGAVNFRLSNLPADTTVSSSALGTSGAVDLAVSGRLQSAVAHAGHLHPGPLAPETPAPPKNPFGAEHRRSLMPDSQLFGQTPFSSVTRHVSPTSSRPSPNDFPQNSISPNPIISSPLKSRGLRSSPFGDGLSSPHVLPQTSSRDQDEGTPHGGAPKEPLAPDSPDYGSPRTRQQPGPIAEYEPMRKSQERRETSDVRSDPGADSEDDLGDDVVQRRRLIRSKKEAALKQLTSISFGRPASSEAVEVPSTNKRKSRSWSDVEKMLAQAPRKSIVDEDAQSTVADSQEQAAAPPQPEEIDDGEVTASDVDEPHTLEDPAEVMPSTGPGLSASGKAAELPGDIGLGFDPDVGDAIPETSPTDARPRTLDDIANGLTTEPSRGASFPASHIEPLEHWSSAKQTNIPTSSLPNLPRQLGHAKASTSRRGRIAASDGFDEATAGRGASGSTTVAESVPSGQIAGGTGKIASPAIPSSPPALGTRARARREHQVSSDSTPRVPSSSAPHAPAPSLSTLSTLSRTPNLSSDTTPLTQDSTSSAKESPKAQEATHSSPAMAKASRRESAVDLPRLRTGLKESLRASTRLTRKQYQPASSSADELGRSPSAPPTFEHSLRNVRAGPFVPKAQSIPREQGARATRIFGGMAFAISFQSKKPGESSEQYETRMEFAKALEKKIEQGGGRLLPDGFDELFEVAPVKSADMSPAGSSPPDTEIKLAAPAKVAGFTALVADGHSRKVKYMQALALGLPCIAPRWITTCLDRQEIVDWSPYLLCAGVSRFLGDAIRSRSLNPYDAQSAKLSDVVQDRPRLLEGSRVLLVMKRSEESKRMAYVFLARVLGASLSRVYTVDEARAKLKASEDLGHPFDWVYVDEKLDTAELFRPAPSAPEGRKRKRGSGGVPSAPPAKKIRTMSDELVIQSLILGRLIEENEMEE